MSMQLLLLTLLLLFLCGLRLFVLVLFLLLFVFKSKFEQLFLIAVLLLLKLYKVILFVSFLLSISPPVNKKIFFGKCLFPLILLIHKYFLKDYKYYYPLN